MAVTPAGIVGSYEMRVFALAVHSLSAVMLMST